MAYPNPPYALPSQLDVLQPLGETLARGAIVALVGIVDDVEAGAGVGKFIVLGMPHQLEQLLGALRRTVVVGVERGRALAPLEPEIRSAVAVEAVEAPG